MSFSEDPSGDASAAQTTPIRRLLPWIAAALPLLPILATLFINPGGSGAATSAPSVYRPPPISPPGTLAQPSGLPPGSGALVALVQTPTEMRRSPGGAPLHHVGLRTGFGSPSAFWVASPRGNWLGVVSDLAGNGRLGWLPRSAVLLSRVNWELRVSLSARRLTVLENGQPVQRDTVAVGSPSAPTPTGRFAVTDRLQTGDPAGPYGCCILALSAQAPHAIQGWDGGNRIAIHSTPETDTIGEAVSHGCLRLTLAEGRWLLSHVPLGTPALISS